MTLRLQPGATAVQAKPHASLPAKAAWLYEHTAYLEAAGMAFRNPQAIYASVAMAIRKRSNCYRMVTVYRYVNDMIEPAAMPMPNLEDVWSLFAGATPWCTLDMLQRLLPGASKWGGVAIRCDHWNFAYIFGSTGAPTSTAVATRLQG